MESPTGGRTAGICIRGHRTPSRTLRFAAGERLLYRYIYIPILDDDTTEGDETFQAILTNPPAPPSAAAQPPSPSKTTTDPPSPSRSEGEQGHDGDAVVGLVAVAECGEHDEAGRFSAPGGVYL